ncbi:hypothetical protein DFJ77DRAFT_177307 [Powellomyces hirtus]|nr:hypothetical protein DFJ77DRAFT_177307 [Powellomyces hirtus]
MLDSIHHDDVGQEHCPIPSGSHISQLDVSSIVTGAATPRFPTGCCAPAPADAPAASCLPSDAKVIHRDTNNPEYVVHANGQAIFRMRSPAAIIFATSPEHVSQAVKCANANGIVPVPRSGGHSYEGLSSLNDALVIDLSRMSTVQFPSDGSNTVVASPGIRLGNLYTALYDRDPSWSFPAGVCPTVGLGGHVAAGGYGAIVRKHGLAADNVVAATVVLADGSIVKASEAENRDLFFAIRGGGGGSYGIVVDMTLKVAHVPYHYVAKITYWNIEDTDKIVEAWYNWLQGPLSRSDSPVPNGGGKTFDGRDLNMQLNVFKDSLSLVIHYTPSDRRSADELAQILKHSGMAGDNVAFGWEWSTFPTQVSTLIAHAFAYGKENLDENAAREVVSVPQDHSDESWKDRSRLKSEYVSGPLQSGFYATIRDIILQARSQLGGAFAMIQLEPYGGILADTPQDINAFPHRSAQFVIQYGLYFKRSLPDPEIPNGLAWLNETQRKLEPYVSGGHYQGYVDLDVQPQSFYGQHLDTLTRIKHKYDPTNRFWSDLVRPKSRNTIWFGEEYAH